MSGNSQICFYNLLIKLFSINDITGYDLKPIYMAINAFQIYFNDIISFNFGIYMMSFLLIMSLFMTSYLLVWALYMIFHLLI